MDILHVESNSTTVRKSLLVGPA